MARLRRKGPEWVVIHRANLSSQDIGEHEGLPVTAVSRSIMDVLLGTHRIDVARQSVSDAVREGLLNSAEASSLRRSISQILLHLHFAKPLQIGNRIKLVVQAPAR